MSSKHQPIDAEITASNKACYQCMQIVRAVEMLEEDSRTENVYKADVATVM